jgi:hypothetical protein
MTTKAKKVRIYWPHHVGVHNQPSVYGLPLSVNDKGIHYTQVTAERAKVELARASGLTYLSASEYKAIIKDLDTVQVEEEPVTIEH